MRILFLFLLVVFAMGFGSCNSETLFKSNFDANAVDQPPPQAQAVGTVTVEGNVVVTTLPGLPSQKGVRIDAGTISGAALQCNLTQHPAAGTFVFSAVFLRPSTSGGSLGISFHRATPVVSPGTETKAALVGGGQRFLHLDLLGTSVRIDDDNSTIFGQFPQDQVFIVQVTLNLNATPTAHIVLSGAGASGEATRNLQPANQPVPLDFGAVRIETVLTADEQKFYATNIVVQRKS